MEKKTVRMGRVPNAGADAFVAEVQQLLERYAPEVDLAEHVSDGSTICDWTPEDKATWQAFLRVKDRIERLTKRT